jgi:hypothetical protein
MHGSPLIPVLGSIAGTTISLIACAVLSLGCHAGGDEAGQEQPPGPSGEATLGQTASAAPAFYGGDVGRLRIDGAPDRILVRSGDEAFITVGEYNSWLGSYPLEITSEDPSEARRQALEQMVVFKMIAQQARGSGYQEESEPGKMIPDEKTLVLNYIRRWVSNVSSVTEDQVQSYADREAARLHPLDSPDIPQEMKMMFIKTSVRGEQLAAQVEAWKEEARIDYGDVSS